MISGESLIENDVRERSTGNAFILTLVSSDKVVTIQAKSDLSGRLMNYSSKYKDTWQI